MPARELALFFIGQWAMLPAVESFLKMSIIAQRRTPKQSMVVKQLEIRRSLEPHRLAHAYTVISAQIVARVRQ
jgi:hypothetical protein